MVKMKVCLLLCVFVLTSALPTAPKRRSKRAIGGDPAAPGQFPFIVSLNLNDNEHNCGGSILNEHWIVTAAHCVAAYWPYEYTVLAGTNLLDSGGQRFSVSRIIVHPDYSDRLLGLTDDIALVEIDGAFEFGEAVRPIAIGKVSAGDPVIVAGWGLTEYSDVYWSGTPDALQFARVVALSNRGCERRARKGSFEFPKNRGTVCTLAQGRVAPCYGDSGGPLVFNDTLVGIVSYAISPCAKGLPDVYTRATHYVHWINDIVKNN